MYNDIMIAWFLIIYTLDVFRLVTWVYFAPSTVIDIEQWLGDSMSYDALIAIPALFVALLIPIAFFLMERQDLYGFDKNVILDKIILARISIPLVFLVSVVLVLKMKILSILFVMLLLCVAMCVLIRVYKWTASVEAMKYKTTYRQHMRLRFLRNIKSATTKVDIWTIILNDEELMEKNQRGLVSEFIEAANELSDSGDGYFRTNLLGLMNRNLSKIDFTDITSYESLVEYSVGYFSKRAEGDTQSGQADRSHKTPARRVRWGLARNLLRIALDTKNNIVCDGIYFDAIKKYIKKEGINEAGFMCNLFDFMCDFLPTYISVAKESGGYDAGGLRWLFEDSIGAEDMPEEKTKEIPVGLLKTYLEAIKDDVQSSADLSMHEMRVINDVTGCLFPSIDFAFWFDIIAFYSPSYVQNQGEDSTCARIRNYVSSVRDFGLIGGISIDDLAYYSGVLRVERYRKLFKKLDKETMYILMRLFDSLRDRDEIQKVLGEITNIIDEELFKGDSVEMLRLKLLKLRFEAMLSYIDKIANKDRESY